MYVNAGEWIPVAKGFHQVLEQDGDISVSDVARRILKPLSAMAAYVRK